MSCLLAAALVVSSVPSTALASHLGGGYCDTGIPSDEQLGFNAFPRGDVFCPLLADPKTEGSFASYLRGTSTSAFGTDLASVGLGDQFGLFRWNGPGLGEGVQLSVSGNVYAQFDLDTESFDLINADYVIGLPLTFRRGAWSSRVRLYHQSSHLGDEYLLRPEIERENFAFESIEAMLSADLGPLRAYGGGEYLFSRTPESLVSRVAHGGAELLDRAGLIPVGGTTRIALVAAVDAKTAEELDWAVAWSARAGFEIRRTAGDEHRSKRWRILAEYYDGPSPYGQFFRENVAYYGVGLHLGR
jgi:hypothetical protein